MLDYERLSSVYKVAARKVLMLVMMLLDLR
jgi:hypothetical protein